MDLQEAVDEANAVRAQFATYERATYGREWRLSDLVAGLMTDVGDLSRLVAARDRRSRAHRVWSGWAASGSPWSASALGLPVLTHRKRSAQDSLSRTVDRSHSATAIADEVPDGTPHGATTRGTPAMPRILR